MAIGFFDGNKADGSPESIKRKREMVARLMSGGRAPRNIGEGFSSIGDSIAAAMIGYRADTAEKANEAERSRLMSGLFGGGAPMVAVGGAPVATGRATGSGATDDTYTGAPRGLFSSESGGRFDAQNNATGAGGMKGHFGRVQFGQARLQEAAAAGAIPQGTTPQQFMASPDLQRAAERWHFADIDNRIKSAGLDQRVGQTINGVPITRDGLVAVAHLGGIRGMERFVETGGRYNPRDANGTSLMDYFARMGGQPQMASNMPVVRPGPGAAPMPLARQNVQTAPMPNVGLADMPAPGANQSAMNVAPVSGDNPQQLLADAAYYEQNGNPEAARQMRERAAMAGQSASAGPQSNEGLSQDGAGELQAGIAPSWAGNAEIVAPGAQEVSGPRQVVAPIPPQRPADLAQQPQRQPLPVDMGGENGATPMAFIQDQFARQDQARGIAPRQIYNPFVQRPPEAPQTPAGGGSVPGDAQPAPMGGAPAAQAQAQAQGGIITPEYVRAVMTSRATTDADKRWVMDMYNQQRATQQAEAERARADQQYTRLAKDLGLTEAEVREPEVVKRRVEERFRQKPGPNTEVMRDPNTGEIVAVDRNNPSAGVKVLREGGADPRAPTTKSIKQPDGSEVAVQWNPNSKTWEPMTAPQGGNAVRAPGKLSEQQAKDLVYYNRGIQALADLGDGSALTGSEGLVGNTIGQIPVVGNFAKSEKFQQAEQSGRNFLNSILRKDTGAAITNQEMAIYGGVFLPQPGDSSLVIEQKSKARRQAIDAIRDGLGPADVLALGQRLTRREDAKTPTPDRPGATTAPGTPSAPPPSPAQGGFRILKVE